MAAEKYIVAKSFFMGFIRKSVQKGMILSVDKDSVTVEGEVFNDVRDVKIALRMSQTGEKLLVPFKENDPSVKKIVSDVKAKLMAVAPAKTSPAMAVVKSESDVLGVKDISDTCVSKKEEARKKEIAEARKRPGEMSVIRDAETETPISKMKIVKSEEDAKAEGKKPVSPKKRK